jgi:hypothetical protein
MILVCCWWKFCGWSILPYFNCSWQIMCVSVCLILAVWPSVPVIVVGQTVFVWVFCLVSCGLAMYVGCQFSCFVFLMAELCWYRSFTVITWFFLGYPIVCVGRALFWVGIKDDFMLKGWSIVLKVSWYGLGWDVLKWILELYFKLMIFWFGIFVGFWVWPRVVYGCSVLIEWLWVCDVSVESCGNRVIFWYWVFYITMIFPVIMCVVCNFVWPDPMFWVCVVINCID